MADILSEKFRRSINDLKRKENKVLKIKNVTNSDGHIIYKETFDVMNNDCITGLNVSIDNKGAILNNNLLIVKSNSMATKNQILGFKASTGF